MKIKQRMLVLAVILCFALPTFVQGVTYVGDEYGGDSFDQLLARGGSDDGDIYVRADNFWLSDTGYAMVYKLITPSTSGKIKIGVDWDLGGHMRNGIWGKASWRAYYFWAYEDDLWSFAFNAGSMRYSTWDVDSDEASAFLGETIWTSADWSSATKYTVNDLAVTANEEICVGIWIRFDVLGDSEIYRTILSRPLHVTVNSIAWEMV